MDTQEQIEELKLKYRKILFLTQIIAELEKLGITMKTYCHWNLVCAYSSPVSLISPHSLSVAVFDKKRLKITIRFDNGKVSFYHKLIRRIFDRVKKIISRHPNYRKLIDPDRVAKRMIMPILIFEKIIQELVIPQSIKSIDGITEEDLLRITNETISKFP